MKLIISYNSEYDRISFIRALSEQEDPVKAFETYFIKRVCELLDVSEEEAKELIKKEDEASWLSFENRECIGSIYFAGEFEKIELQEIPAADVPV